LRYLKVWSELDQFSSDLGLKHSNTAVSGKQVDNKGSELFPRAFHSSHIAFAFSWFSISQYLIGSDQSEAFRDTSKLENAFAVELKDESAVTSLVTKVFQIHDG
jgi:hypothetical protein